ncbi:MAG: HdaA/DnaA family protein [Gammaproteobacteria bacterium]
MIPTTPRSAQQLLFPFQDPSGSRFENFIAEGNQVILESCRELALGEAAGLLVLHGPAGSGKSHLLRASCGARIERDGRAALWVASPNGSDARHRALPDEREADFDLLALDGIEAIAGDPIREEVCFRLVLSALQGRLRLLLADRQAPQALPWVLPDLASRLKAATLPPLKPLTEELRLRVIQERSEVRGMQLDAPAARWLLHHWPRDLESLLAVLDRLEEQPGAVGKRITLAFLKRALSQVHPIP